jgi:hypothetical protein
MVNQLLVLPIPTLGRDLPAFRRANVQTFKRSCGLATHTGCALLWRTP